MGVERDGQAVEWFMDYRNADGSLSEMCGNGIRVFARHLVDEGLVDPSGPIDIATRDGIKTLLLEGDVVTVDLGVAAAAPRDQGVGRRRRAGPPSTSTSATRTPSRSSTTRRPWPGSTSHGHLATTRRSTPTASTSSSWCDGASATWRCASTSAARVRRGRAAPVPAPCWSRSRRRDAAPRPATYTVDVPGGTLTLTWTEDDRVLLDRPGRGGGPGRPPQPLTAP